MSVAKKNGRTIPMSSFAELENELTATQSFGMNFTALTKRDQRLQEEVNTRRLVTAGRGAHALTIQRELGKIHAHGSIEFSAMTHHHSEINQANKGKEYEDFVKQYNDQDLELMLNQLRKIIFTAGFVFAEELAEAFDMDKDPEVIIQQIIKEVPRASLWERIFGRPL